MPYHSRLVTGDGQEVGVAGVDVVAEVGVASDVVADRLVVDGVVWEVVLPVGDSLVAADSPDVDIPPPVVFWGALFSDSDGSGSGEPLGSSGSVGGLVGSDVFEEGEVSVWLLPEEGSEGDSESSGGSAESSVGELLPPVGFGSFFGGV